jgi:hypothetical protein
MTAILLCRPSLSTRSGWGYARWRSSEPSFLAGIQGPRPKNRRLWAVGKPAAVAPRLHNRDIFSCCLASRLPPTERRKVRHHTHCLTLAPGNIRRTSSTVIPGKLSATRRASSRSASVKGFRSLRRARIKPSSRTLTSSNSVSPCFTWVHPQSHHQRLFQHDRDHALACPSPN